MDHHGLKWMQLRALCGGEVSWAKQGPNMVKIWPWYGTKKLPHHKHVCKTMLTQS